MHSPRVSKVWDAVNQLCAIPLFALLVMVAIMFTCMYCLTGCGVSGTESTKKEVVQLEYYKDVRTSLCFVRNSVTNSNGFSDNVFTNVPCSPEVEALIK